LHDKEKLLYLHRGADNFRVHKGAYLTIMKIDADDTTV